MRFRVDGSRHEDDSPDRKLLPDRSREFEVRDSSLLFGSHDAWVDQCQPVPSVAIHERLNGRACRLPSCHYHGLHREAGFDVFRKLCANFDDHPQTRSRLQLRRGDAGRGE